MKRVRPLDIVRVGNIVGEGILWDPNRSALWWTDIQGSRLYRRDWAYGTLEILEAPERIGSFGLIAGSGQLIVAFASGIARYDPFSRLAEPLPQSPAIPSGVRFNDGRVDREGRFWTGTMVERAQLDAVGCLYSVDAARQVRCHLSDIRIANGLCFSPDGSRMYFADSPTRTINVYTMRGDGTLGSPTLFALTPQGAYPDGAAVDADGCVWSAHWGAGCVIRYTPDGRIDQRLAIPTAQPSCVCFAGPNLDVLCVTSAREGLGAAALAAEPNAGDVFLYRTGAQGLPESEYRHA